jgi:very-short-patch-repair endonuclease
MKWVTQYKEYFVKFKISIEDTLKLYRQIKKEFENRNFSNQVVLKYFKIFVETNTLDFDYEKTLNRCLSIRDDGKSSVTKKKHILLYGEQIGLKKWELYCERQRYTNSKEYKKMSKDEFDLYNKSRAVTKENLSKKYGEQIGLKKWESYCERQRYTNTLEYYVEKYGKEGSSKWKKYNKSKAHTVDNYIKKYGENDGIKKYKQFYENSHKYFYSKISEEMFVEIEKSLNIECKIYYAKNEFGKYNTDSKKYNFYDFVIEDLKICIEFNGDVFHGNPKLYKETDYPNPFNKKLSAKELWEADKIKNNFLKKLGYNVIVIWEKDYLENKEKLIKNTVSYIKEEYVRNRRIYS